jgi:hypothetical protein
VHARRCCDGLCDSLHHEAPGIFVPKGQAERIRALLLVQVRNALHV